MDFSKLLEFPGILIIIGIVLIIIAIILGVVAQKKETEDVTTEIASDPEDDEYIMETMNSIDDTNIEKPSITDVDLIKNNVLISPIDDEETILEEPQEEIKKDVDDDFLETKEFVILDDVKEETNDIEML